MIPQKLKDSFSHKSLHISQNNKKIHQFQIACVKKQNDDDDDMVVNGEDTQNNKGI